MNVRAMIEEKLDNVSGSSHNAPMKRSAAGTIAEIDERRICFEQFPYTLNVSRGRSPVNLVILARRRLRDPSAAVAGLLEQHRDAFVAALSGHFDQAQAVICVPFRISTRIEKHLHYFEVPSRTA